MQGNPTAAAAIEHGHQQQQQQQQFLADKLTMLLLLQEPTAWGPAEAWADQQQLKQWQQLLDASVVSIVEGEVQYLRQQLLHIEDVCSLLGGLWLSAMSRTCAIPAVLHPALCLDVLFCHALPILTVVRVCNGV